MSDAGPHGLGLVVRTTFPIHLQRRRPMSLKTLENDRKYGEPDQAVRAHVGCTADCEEALEGCLRLCRRTRPRAISAAEHQSREAQR